MIITNDQTVRMAELVFTLRQKCALKDLYFVKTLSISSAEYNCLVQFFKTDSMGVKQLAERLDITPGGVTRIVTSLEEKGLIERRISPEDRRSVDVYLTPKGHEMVADIRQEWLELHGEILNQIEPEYREPVLQAMEKLTRAIDNWLQVHDNVLDG